MGKRVNALSNKMETFDFLLIIMILELDDPLEKEFVSKPELLKGNSALIDYANANN